MLGNVHAVLDFFAVFQLEESVVWGQTDGETDGQDA